MSGAGFALDLGRCVGCEACVLACRIENEWPEGVRWRRVLALNRGRHPDGPTWHLSVACHHCEDPACLTACPTGAIRKRPDGVVVIDAESCIGCRYCAMACPFGAPSYDAGSGTMTKCHLCRHRLDAGREPACTEACPTTALRFLQDVPAGTVQGPGVPGFADPADCRPALDLRLPAAGAIRTERLERLRTKVEDRRP